MVKSYFHLSFEVSPLAYSTNYVTHPIHNMSFFLYIITNSLSLSNSAASAGALEFMTIYSTSNLPKLLNGAKEDGWRILGAAAEVPDGGANSKDGQYGGGGDSSRNVAQNNNDNEWDLGGMEEEDEDVEDEVMDDVTATEDVTQQCFDLHKVETGSPTILVLGSEGESFVKKHVDGGVVAFIDMISLFLGSPFLTNASHLSLLAIISYPFNFFRSRPTHPRCTCMHRIR